MRRSICALGVLTVLFAPTFPSPATASGNTMMPYSRVEIVFALDTTGSMGGMISEAKQKIWSIVSALADVEPTPAIRLGLLAFRDHGDVYVTKLVPLTSDIDAAYVQLMGFDAQGGGDGPESVNQALHEAVSLFDWSNDPATLRVIFLVGDSPPHMDYRRDVPYPHSCTRAAQLGIRISTIQCGNQATTRKIWTDIAKCARGDYFAIRQPGSNVPIETPYDWQLALHARLLDKTILPYGTEQQQAAHRRRLEISRTIDKEASAEAKAERARFKAGSESLVEDGDLVDDVQRGTTDLASVSEERLPDELKRIPEDRRRQYVDDLAAQRRGLQSEIEWFAKKREEYIEQHYGRQDQALDRRVVRSLLATPAPEDE
jgi:hypothetical protein